MKFPWAIRLAREDASALASLRLTANLEVAESGAEVWLRGQPADESLEALLSGLPARARFEWRAPRQLRRIDQRVPSATLPELRWQPLRTWLQIDSSAAALPGNQPAPFRLRLERSAAEREPEFLLTRLEEFQRFTNHAPQVRLGPLQFASAADGHVLVRGKPLPPLPGQRFVLHHGVAVPVGFAWRPAVSEEVLARCFNVSGDRLVLWHEDGTSTRLHSEQFFPVSRSAVRETVEGSDDVEPTSGEAS